MFSGSGGDSDSTVSTDLPKSSNGGTRFSLKLLYFFSGVALLALVLSVFVQTSILYAVFSAGLFAVFFFVWLWAVFEADVVRRLKIAASKASVITASIISAILELIGIFLAGTSLVYASDMMLKTYGDFIDLILSHVRESFLNIANSLMAQSEPLAWAAAVIFGVLSFFIVYLVVKRLIATRYSAIVKKEGLSSVLLFALASALWVFVPLLPLYLTNINNVSLLFVLLLAVIYMIGTLTVYFIALFISRSALASFGVCVIAWIGLSMSEGLITSVLAGIPFVTVLYSVVLLGVMCLGGFGILKAAQEFELSSKKLSKIILALVAVLLVINIVPIVSYNLEAGAVISESSMTMEFVVDDSLQHPNIYWIHADSMVDETVLEKYWGEDTFEFTEKLEERGFYVNHDAYLTGTFSSSTTMALSSMFLPTVYDEYMLGKYPPGSIHAVVYEKFGSSHEFINAFSDAGYPTISIQGPQKSMNIQSPSDVHYSYWNSPIYITEDVRKNSPSQFDNIVFHNLENELLFIQYSAYPINSLLSYLNIEKKASSYYYSAEQRFVDVDYVDSDTIKSVFPNDAWYNVYGSKKLFSALAHSLDNLHTPSLHIIYDDLVHTPYRINEFGEAIPSNVDVNNYYGQYLFSEKYHLYMIDEIIHADPNAIIVLQGDHGPYPEGFEGYNEFFSVDPTYEEYRNHVLSAVRIPEQYQTEDYPEAIQNPRNIVRYLVNSYVGENYEYIPWEEA